MINQKFNIMLDQHPPIKHIIRILGSLLILALAGCNFPGLSPATPTAEVLSSPTLPPAESQVPESETATTTVTEVVPDPIATPTQTLPPVLHDQCRPFPDQLYPALTDGWLKSRTICEMAGITRHGILDMASRAIKVFIMRRVRGFTCNHNVRMTTRLFTINLIRIFM